LEQARCRRKEKDSKKIKREENIKIEERTIVMINFLKSIVVGIGGIAPGLSGSALLVIFGLYEKIIETKE